MDNIRYKPLPDELFFVRVPLIATYSEMEMTTLGLPVNMINGRPDFSTYNTMVPVYLKLDRIIDIFISGYPIRLIDNNSLDRIYTILDEYVRGLNQNDNFELNVPGVVEERLYDIERFAAEIFDNNKVAILRKLISFKNGYDAKVKTMPVYGQPQPMYYNQYEEPKSISHMDSYSTVLSNQANNNYGLNSTGPTLTNLGNEQQGDSVRDFFRVNPNKQELSSTTYINNNLPEINFGSAVRNRTQIRLKQ